MTTNAQELDTWYRAACRSKEHIETALSLLQNKDIPVEAVALLERSIAVLDLKAEIYEREYDRKVLDGCIDRMKIAVKAS